MYRNVQIWEKSWKAIWECIFTSNTKIHDSGRSFCMRCHINRNTLNIHNVLVLWNYVNTIKLSTEKIFPCIRLTLKKLDKANLFQSLIFIFTSFLIKNQSILMRCIKCFRKHSCNICFIVQIFVHRDEIYYVKINKSWIKSIQILFYNL